MRPTALRKLHRAIDRNLAEWVSITPMQSGGYLAGDATGAPVNILAYVADTSSPVRGYGDKPRSGHNADIVGATHTAKFTTSELPFACLAGFVLVRTLKGGQSRFRVSGVYPFGTNRTVLALVSIP